MSIIKENVPKLAPENQFPIPALEESIQKQPSAQNSIGGATLILNIASSADFILPWGENVKFRDQQLRKYWPTESYLAGAVTNTCMRDAAFDWEIQGPSQKVIQAVTEMLLSAIGRDMIGWVPFIHLFSQDLRTQDNGAFLEPIRDPGMDANSKFKGPMAPVIGIAHLDSGACQRTGNVEYPVLYTDIEGAQHKLQWFQVIPFSDFPSPIQRMNGVGICAVTRALRLSQIIRSVAIYKDEEVSGRNIKKINVVGGVSNVQIDDAIKRTVERADNKGNMRFIEHVVLASIDPEKPVSVETIELASLPEGYDYDSEMQWFIAGLALDFGVDYQEFAPLTGGIGSSGQSSTLNKKSYGKGPRNFMDMLSNAFRNYGVMPRGYRMVFKDKNQEEEAEMQEVRTRAAEEAAILVNSKIFPPEVIAQMLVDRGIYPQSALDNTPEEWWKLAMEAAKNEANPKQSIGSRGGNTTAEDAGRTDGNKPRTRTGDRLRKLFGG